jgi:hypothetical protein
MSKPQELQIPFMSRLLARAPGPRYLWVAVLAVVPLAAVFLPHSYVATVGEASFRVRFLAGVVFAYAVVLSLTAVTYFDKRVREARGSIASLTSDPGMDLFASLDSAVGPFVLTGIFVVATTFRTWMQADLGSALAWLPVTLLANLPVMSAFFMYMVLLLGLHRLGSVQLSLRAFPEDRSLGLSSVGHLAVTAFWIFVAASIPILLVNSGDALRLALSLAVFLTGIGIFFASIWRLHRRMVTARAKHIDHSRLLYAQTYEPLRSDPAVLERNAQSILAARAIEEDALSIQMWPFDDRRLKEIAAIVGTIVTFTGTGIITRLIYEKAIL